MYGASVRGLGNRRRGRANQDAWVRVAGAFGHLIAVCDGMGSRRTPEIGAHAACRALRRAVRIWLEGAPPAESPAATLLIRLVEVLWRIELATCSPTECATTCLFALRACDGRLLLAGLGDGLAIVRDGRRNVETFGGRTPDGFGDETVALGTPHRIDDWWIVSKPASGSRTVVLVTDGVADDLAADRLAAFTDWLVVDVGRLSPAVRWRRLCRELRTWPVPRHTDDKTVAVLVESPGEDS